MIDIGTLDTIIAMVVVLLVLSLLVQSIQQLFKKITKVKSRVVMNSLLDLFQYVKTNELVGQTPEKFLELVKNEFHRLGRESVRGRLMMDSIAKDDLLKIITKLANDPKVNLNKLQPEALSAQVDHWFEAVMQSFDERYTRNMKTVAVIISAVVVIVLNANVFTIYRNIALDGALRAAIVTAAPQIQGQSAETGQQTNGSRTPPNQQTEIKQQAGQVAKLVNEYKGLGFSPLTPRQISDFLQAEGVWQGATAAMRFSHLAEVLLGWSIMTLLLSAGAPFWEDTLESLFGIKNLLRRRSDTGNVEDRGGQQKP